MVDLIALVYRHIYIALRNVVRLVNSTYSYRLFLAKQQNFIGDILNCAQRVHAFADFYTCLRDLQSYLTRFRERRAQYL